MQPFFCRGQLERNLTLRHTETHNYWTEGDPYTFWIFLIYSTCLFIYSALLIFSHVVLILYSVSVKLSPFLINLDVSLYLLEIYVFSFPFNFPQVVFNSYFLSDVSIVHFWNYPFSRRNIGTNREKSSVFCFLVISYGILLTSRSQNTRSIRPSVRRVLFILKSAQEKRSCWRRIDATDRSPLRCSCDSVFQLNVSSRQTRLGFHDITLKL